MFKTLTVTKPIYIFVGILLAVSFSVYAANTEVVDERELNTYDRYNHYTLIDESDSNATSSALTVYGSEKVEFYFTANGATSTFAVEVSPDGSSWYDYNKLISNIANSNSQEITRVGSVSFVNATSTTLVSLDLTSDTFYQVRCVGYFASTTVSAGDSNTCEASVLR